MTRKEDKDGKGGKVEMHSENVIFVDRQSRLASPRSTVQPGHLQRPIGIESKTARIWPSAGLDITKHPSSLCRAHSEQMQPAGQFVN